MSKPSDLTAKIRFIFEVEAAAGVAQLEQAADGVKTLRFNIGEMSVVQNNIKQATSAYGSSVRGLLLNLRMFSFAVRTLRRELGNSNPVIEQISTSLITFAAAATGIVAGLDLLSRVSKVFAGTSLPAFIGAVKVAIGVLGGLPVVLSVIGGILTISLAKGLFEITSGISRLRREAKDLEQDLLILKTSLEALNLEQERFSLGLAGTSLEMMKLKQAIDLQQSGTEALEAQLEAVTAEYQNQRIAEAELNLVSQERNLILKEGEELANDLARREQAIRIARASRGYVTEEEAFQALEMTGWVQGQPLPKGRRVFELAREQTRAGVAAPRLGGGANVTINFPNALFQTVEGVREAILGAAREAADIIRFNQYAEPGNQR
jgi:hypothetical protein